MDYKGLKWQFVHRSFARRLIVKIFLFALAMIVISFTQIAHEIRTIDPLLLNFDECPIEFGSNSNANSNPNPRLKISGVLGSLSSLLTPCKDSENLTIGVLKELMKKGMLVPDARALCVGEGSALAVSALRELGFSNAYGVQRHPFFSLLQKRFVYELDFKDNYFDFVFSRALDKVSVPALLVLEIERVLRPGGTGAMLVGAPNFSSGSLVRSATPISLFLKSSNVIHVCGIGFFTLVIFKKRFDNVALFEHYRLPNECPTIANNKPFMKHIEPLVDKRSGQHDTEISYLPKFMNISSRNRLMYINIGAGELVHSSIAKALKPNYPIQPQDFNVYVIDHNPSALSSYVKNPGITFVYHPGLVSGESAAPSITSDEYMSAPLDEEGFEIIRWFQETIEDADYVVLMMNAGVAELKLLFEFFETGAICHVDELFLRCSDGVHCKDGSCGDCMSLFRGLRNGGVFVHQWYGD